MKKAPHHLRRKGMPIDKLLEGAVGKFEIETYSGGRDLSSDYVPFTGALKKHPYDETKVVVDHRSIQYPSFILRIQQGRYRRRR